MVGGRVELVAEPAAQPGLLLDLAQRGVLPALAVVELALGQRPVVVARAMHDRDAVPLSPAATTTPPAALTSAVSGSTVHRRASLHRTNVTQVSSSSVRASPSHRLRHRRRLVRHRRRQDAPRARLRRSTATRSPTASAATGCSATATGCRRPTARCTSTPRASAWSTPTSRCRSPIPTSRTTRTSPRYFDDYVDHFGFRDRIRFETGVEHAARRADGVWEIALDDGDDRRRYDALMVANGHHWDARWPEPAFPGGDDVRGRADALARLQGRRPGLLPRQERRRARHGQLGDGHRGRRLELRRRAHLPRRAARRARDPQVPVRQADRPDRRLAEDPVRGPRARSSGRC